MNIKKSKSHFIVVLLGLLILALADFMGLTTRTQTIELAASISETPFIQLAKAQIP